MIRRHPHRLPPQIAGLLAVMVAAMASGLGAPARAAVSNLVKTPHVQAQLVSETTAAAPGSTVYVALHQTIIPGWHTYWRNPGDAGQATTLALTLPAGWSAGDIVWPAPKRELSGPVMSYVYTGAVDLPVPIAVPASAKAGQSVELAATANWLVCKDVCVPESGRLTLRLPVSDAAATTEPPGWRGRRRDPGRCAQAAGPDRAFSGLRRHRQPGRRRARGRRGVGCRGGPRLFLPLRHHRAGAGQARAGGARTGRPDPGPTGRLAPSPAAAASRPPSSMAS